MNKREMREKIRKCIGENKLARYVWHYALERASDYNASDKIAGALDFLAEVCEHGCVSGVWTPLVYWKETSAFYRRYRREIGTLVAEGFEEGLFGDKGLSCLSQWEPEDPLANDGNNQNVLAWYGVEEWARNIGRAVEDERF